jgi:hypothetical protein
MRETRQSGSEGGVRLIPHPYPYPETWAAHGARAAARPYPYEFMVKFIWKWCGSCLICETPKQKAGDPCEPPAVKII